MKPVVLLLFLVACASARILNDNVSPRTAYGYLTKYGIPQAERIRKAEDEYLRSRSSRITGGAPAGEAQFPYKAGVIAELRNIRGEAVCGGSLIRANRVLTAASCWWDGTNQANSFTIVLGSNLLFSGGVRISTEDITTHPLWIPLLTFNDLAYATFPDVELSASIAIIALPDALDIFDNFRRQQAVASGFGQTSNNGIIDKNQFLNYANLTVITNEVCNVAHVGQIRYSNICANSLVGGSTCAGDNGGPLAITRNNQPLLIGVTSFNLVISCELGWPSVFTRVTSFLTFINSN